MVVNNSLHYFFIISVACVLFIGQLAQAADKPMYKNPNLPIDQRVTDLLQRMTLEEKIGQLQCMISEVEKTGLIEKGLGGLGCILRPFAAAEAANKMNRLQKLALEKSRLGIPILMHDEALHGLVGNAATAFPQAIGLAATWDTELMAQVATAIARETKSRGIRQVLSPVVNIARDVRWGRVEESYGEDPFLTARMGVAFCKSFEQEGVITTPKHYAANVGDGGRDSNPIHFSERLMREIYLPAFKACFQEGNATSVMAAYNSYDGTPCSSNRWLLTDVLRGEWGFQGFVVSDYGSVAGILDLHRTAADKLETAKQAVEAGMDVELPNIYIFGEPLLEAVKKGLIAEAIIDQAVRRVLTAKFKLGLFENPYVDPKEAARINDSPAHRQLARQAAREAMVLLKNENRVLPLAKDIKTLAVIGPYANSAPLGGYSGFGMKTVTPLEGIKHKVAATTKVIFEPGGFIGMPMLPQIQPEHLIPAGAKAGEQGLKAEYFNNMDLSGKPVLVRIDRQVHFDWGGGSPDPAVRTEQFSARWTGKLVPPVTGRYRLGVMTDDGVRLYIDGKLVIEYWRDRGPTADVITMELEAGREYDVRMEYYENGGGAFASLGWDYQPDFDKNIQQAIMAVQQADAAVLFLGVIEGEGRDRANLDLPGQQEQLIKAVSATGKPTIVVLMTGSAVTMQHWVQDVPAIIEAWYPGEEGGNAIADVLFGDYNPGGKLPITFPQSVAQVPLYYNTKPTGRGYDYVDMTGAPQFAFGHGLSYTRFEYSNLTLAPTTMRADQNLVVSCDIKNVGSMAGDEVVQLYLHDVIGSVARPLKELKGFQRVTLAPGETKTVRFVLTPEHLSMYDAKMNWGVEPGQFEIMIGSSAADIRLQGKFEVIE
ncbi:MAG: glycoside hydrolase family 3 C-terminal domain-containing protein [candidate division KSB1 bacterium]|nr:glycoside hydrolase family 3 C-terminal domain-containing protein [candidate division KSB1 bacterium]